MRRIAAGLAAACALSTIASGTHSADAALPPLKFGAFAAAPRGNDLPVSNTKLNTEWIQLTNTTTRAINLTGYTVRDNGDNHIFRFPRNFVLGAKKTVTIRTGRGTASATNQYFGKTTQYVWNNTGDTARLVNSRGAVTHRCTYTKALSGMKYC